MYLYMCSFLETKNVTFNQFCINRFEVCKNKELRDRSGFTYIHLLRYSLNMGLIAAPNSKAISLWA